MLLSTNPIAVGIPSGAKPSIVLDMATTVAAYGKVKAKVNHSLIQPKHMKVFYFPLEGTRVMALH